MLEPIALAEALRFRPHPHWDPVPDWILKHLKPEILREVAVVQLRFQRNVLEQQVKAIAEVEKLVGRG